MYEIRLQPNNYLNKIESYLIYNQIDYKAVDLWCDTQKKHLFNANLDNCLYILDQYTFYNMVTDKDSSNSLKLFLQKKNRILVTGEFDVAQVLCDNEPYHNFPLLAFDKEIEKNKVFIISDSVVTNRSVLYKLKNITILSQPLYAEFYNGCPRFQQSLLPKNVYSKDFLISTVIDPNGANNNRKLHRRILVNKIKQHQDLLENSYFIIHEKNNQHKNWIWAENASEGQFSDIPVKHWYKDSFVEIVPETRYRDLYQPTEKIWKPIITKTPFLVCSNAYFLKYLKSLGFKTFDSLIDESYDSCFRIQDRVNKIVKTMHDIKNNGASSFYNACEDILNYNYKLLCEIYGGGQINYDETLNKILTELTLDTVPNLS